MAKKVLIVDDDPVVVRYLTQVLEDNGYETCSAEDGVKAHEVLEQETPDLISLDLEMPDEWGTKFYRRMSKDPRFKEIPVIVVSGMAGRHLSIKKAAAFLSKPFDPDKLIAAVRKTIGDP